MLTSCDVGEPEINHVSRGFDRPPVAVIGASVTTSYTGEGRPVRAGLSDGGTLMGAVSNPSVKLFFSRWLLPHKVTRQSICIHPTTTTVASSGQCPQQAFAEPAYDPTDRSVTYRLPAGTHLALDTQYRVSVFKTESIDPESEGENGFYAFDGAAIDKDYAFDFVTEAAESADEERLPSPDAYCAAIDCFAACAAGDTLCEDNCAPTCIDEDCYQQGSFLNEGALFGTCAFGYCHAPDFGNTLAIAMGLDLSTRTAIEQTAVNQTAHQTQQGQLSSVGDQSPQRFGRAMPLVDPGNPGNSYIMYKVLSNPLNQPRPGGQLDAGLALSIDRIRDGFVVGLPMPAQSSSGEPTGVFPSDADPEGDKSFAQAQLISAWIAHGAVTSCP
jgi:hypothetical protein